MNSPNRPTCSDCESRVDRRTFIRAAGGAAVAGVAANVLWDGARFVHAAPTSQSTAETAAGRFYASLTADQKKAIAFPFDHELRKKINANWHVTKQVIKDDFYSNEQRALINDVLKGITSEEGYKQLQDQMEFDAGGVGEYSVAVFGEPGSGKFEWEMTGRHLTLRADGNSVDKAAFGGPIVYGHGEEDPAHNLFYHQTKSVNEVFKALDGKQMEKALLPKAPAEAAVGIQGASGAFPGIAISELSKDQTQLVEKTLKKLLSPYRKEDVDEVFEILKASGGIGKLHLAFYSQNDLKDDKIWDIWRVEGPNFVWHFRGAPHVHAYINIGG